VSVRLLLNILEKKISTLKNRTKEMHMYQKALKKYTDAETGKKKIFTCILAHPTPQAARAIFLTSVASQKKKIEQTYWEKNPYQLLCDVIETHRFRFISLHTEVVFRQKFVFLQLEPRMKRQKN
jgi:hypothetical protein